MPLVSISVLAASAQSSNELEARFTPNIIAPSKVVNPSPATVSAQPRFAFDAGIAFNHMYNSRWGIKAGVDIGIVSWNRYFKAPQSAFGTKQGNGNVEFYDYEMNYQYNALSAAALYKFRWKNLNFRTYLGPSLRYYWWGIDGFDSRWAFNRSKPFDFQNPNAGLPDLLIDVPRTGRKLHLDIHTGIGIERKFSPRSSMTFGFKKDWGVRPIGKGALQVQMYDKLYNGEFSPRSNYWGVDLIFNYKLAKREEKTYKPQIASTDSGKTRKAFFVEYGGNGFSLTGNFDMRFNRGRNDGLGFRAGLGVGSFYFGGHTVSRYVTVPLGLNYIVGKRRSGLETGIGITPSLAPFDINDDQKAATLDGVFNLGYRFQPLGDDLMFRAGWSPTFDRKYFDPLWGGLSLGYSFINWHKKEKNKSKPKENAPTVEDVGKRRKSIYAELLGAGAGISSSFDIRLKPDRNDGFGFRAGVGTTGPYLNFPVGINYLAGSRRSALETGIGYTQLIKYNSVYQDKKQLSAAIFTLGYRYQPIKEGLLFRINWNPYYSEKKVYVLLPGASIGYSFK